MKRLHYFNLLGILVLAALSVAQWQRDRRLNLSFNQLEKTRLEQAAKISEQEQTLRGVNADLAQFKEQFTKAQSELAETSQKLRLIERQTNQLTIERDQLKASITNWVAAVTSRDERIKEASAQIRKFADDLNASIRKYNELVTNHNAVVNDLKELRNRVSQSPPGNPAQPARQPESGRNPQ